MQRHQRQRHRHWLPHLGSRRAPNQTPSERRDIFATLVVQLLAPVAGTPGVGAGLVIHRQIYQGAHGFAHEIANIPLWKDGPSHGTIYPGGVEAISSGTAITSRAQKAGLTVTHAGEVNDLAVAGNETAAQIIDDAKEYLANAIAIIYAFLDPDIVVLGGSVALKIPGFVEDVEMRVRSKVFSTIAPLVHVVKTNLNEDSGLLGGACLVFSKNR